MASWTDKTPTFNPYVQQLPVDAMVQVGMHKQQQYDEGIQKIQTNIDNIAGLDVIRDVDKNYLQSKLNSLGNNLKTVAAGDFSNFQLVNSVNGMTNQNVKDANVVNAVSSAASYRKEVARIQKDTDDGKSNPANTHNFNKGANAWLNSSNVGEKFNTSYTPYFDVDKFTKETFDAIKPDGFSYDQIYQLDCNGKPMHDKRGNLVYSTTMTRMDKEGIFPPKVKETLNQIFSDARVGQQLNISGQYNYRGYSPEQLAQKVVSQKQSILGTYTEQLGDLTLQKSMGKDVQKNIDDLTAKMNTVSSSYDEYAKIAESDPDAVRGSLFKDDVSARYTTMYGSIKDKTQVMDNPAWKAEFDMQKEANEQSRFAQTLHQQKIAHADEMGYKYDALKQQDILTRLAIDAKGKGKKTLGGAPGTGEGPGTGPGGTPSEQGDQSAAIEAIRVQSAKYEQAASDYSNTSDGLMWETVFGKIPTNEVKLKGLMSNGMKREVAVSLLINNAAKQSGLSSDEFKSHWVDKAVSNFNNLTPEEKSARPIIADSYSKFKDSKRIFDSELTVKKRIDAQTKLELRKV